MFPAANSQQRLSVNSTTRTNTKVPLKPGRSLVDWVRLTKSGKDLRGTGAKLLRITPEELSKHNKPNDLWLALRGMVFNVTEYLEYHPGGADELMRGAGKDATSLFEEVHRWVNYESMLRECLIGKLVGTPSVTNTKLFPRSNMLAPPAPSTSSLNPLGVNTMKIESIVTKNDGVPGIKLDGIQNMNGQGKVSSVELAFDWYQTEKNVILVFYTKCRNFQKNQVVCDILDRREICVDLRIGKLLHSFNVSLQEFVLNSIGILVSMSGKVEITLTKSDFDIHWGTIGNVKRSKENFNGRDVGKMRFCEAKIIDKQTITYNTSLYHIKLPCSRWMQVPAGYHVYLRAISHGISICKPYTPVLKSILSNYNEPGMSSGCDLYLAVKHYDSGGLTSILRVLSQGDSISVSSYDGTFGYSRTSSYSNHVLLAAGTGITPMIKVLYSILHKQTNSVVRLVYFNSEEKDIMWKDDFIALSERFQERFNFENILSRAEESWNGKRGRISKEVVEECLPENVVNEDFFFYVCGPTLFTKLGLSILEQLKYQNVHAFT